MIYKNICVICGVEYTNKRPDGKGTCKSNSCRSKRYRLAHLEKERKRHRDDYYFLKKNDYKKLRENNQRAKSRQRYGVNSRSELLDKFDNRCANCGDNKQRLHIHHIDNKGRKVEGIQKPNNDPKNLVVLCHTCHISHHRGGKELHLKI